MARVTNGIGADSVLVCVGTETSLMQDSERPTIAQLAEGYRAMDERRAVKTHC